MKKNDIIKLCITSVNSDGAGVGRYEGEVVFVPYALPDEVVEVLIIKATKSYAVGKINKIITASPDRCEPKCPYFYRCGGCELQNISYEAQLKLKCNSTVANINKLSGESLEIRKIIGAEKPFFYRTKAQFPISADKDGKAQIGFYAQRSHRLIPIDKCFLQEEYCNAVIPILKEAIKKCSISIYNEEAHKGILRHAVVRKGTDGIMLILVTNSSNPLPADFISEITQKLKCVKTIIQNINTKKGNIILGDRCITLFGNGYIENELCDIKFNLHPLSFLQVNHYQAEKLYYEALKLASLSGNEIVFDAYCGIGVMSLMLAKKSKKLIGVEIVPEAIECAKQTAKQNNIDNAEFYVGACEDVLPRLLKGGEKPDVLVVDPPRAGCEGSLLNAIAETNIKRIVYISCNPATLARDIKQMTAFGYNCSDLTFVDMFCQTKHIETIVLLTKE